MLCFRAYENASLAEKIQKQEKFMNWEMIGFGCLGGLIPDIIRVIKGRYRAELPKYLTSVNFVIGLVFLVLLAGFAAWLGGATQIKEALAYGFAAPELVSRMLASKELTLDKPAPFASISRFWAF
jgi:hypothetical protein